IELDRYDIVQSYMAVGGIPYYMNYFRKGLSLAQNIDSLFFAKNAPLRDEYDRLFASLFGDNGDSKSIVKLLATRRFGFTRKEITQKAGLSSGGTLTKSLAALVNSDFIIPYTPLGAKRETYYKLIDNFCLFYLNFIAKKTVSDESFWQNTVMSPAIASWQGFAFEEVCFSHISQIKSALGIAGVQADISSLIIKKDGKKAGSQIDLLIDRADRVINLCEIKFSNKEFVIDKSYEEKLRQRIEIIRELTKNKKNIHLTFVTTFGLKSNAYSNRVQKSLSMNDLFCF
ncbi:MAG: ATP-binding protein, partial [Bacteroidales bacterium]|nr:ATP-binding protein [Bacteroidales bacterium]